MKTYWNLWIVLVLILLFTSPVSAAPMEWDIDRAHSSVFFDVKHTFATVRGQFDDFSGTILIDPEDHSKSTIDMEVKVASINTNNRQRDNHLRSDEFFSVKKYPVMTFRTTQVKQVKDDVYELEGTLTVKGVTKDVVVPFMYYGVKDNPLNPKQLIAGFEGKFTIDRLDYNVGNGQFHKMGVIGKKVDIIITLEVLRNK
jgi:polyisoprenoid-binding protein YceI